MNAKLNPTPLERRLKLYRILFARWWRANGIVVALWASIMWIWTLWLMLGVGY